MRIIILDDHTLFSEGLGNILEKNIEDLLLIKANSIAELNERGIDYANYDLLISDIELPGEDIFDFLTSLKQKAPSFPVLVVSMHNKLSIIKRCKELGVEGYILKDDHDSIIRAVQCLLIGRSYFSKKVEATFDILKKKEKILTPKEEEIIALVAQGKGNQEIATQLFISYNTVKTHRKNIYRKLNLNSTGELIKYYFQNYID